MRDVSSIPAACRRPPSRSRAGYTLIEVMMALGVLSVGAVGLIALQQATTRGNVQARAQTVAVTVARTWVERLRRDALRWNQQGLAGIRAVPNGPVYLRNVPDVQGVLGDWFAPVAPAGGPLESHGADWWGRDTADPAQMRFCTHLRLRWASAEQTVRADVRTFYFRRGDATDVESADFRLFPNCALGREGEVDAELARAVPRIRVVPVSLVLRWTPINP